MKNLYRIPLIVLSCCIVGKSLAMEREDENSFPMRPIYSLGEEATYDLAASTDDSPYSVFLATEGFGGKEGTQDYEVPTLLQGDETYEALDSPVQNYSTIEEEGSNAPWDPENYQISAVNPEIFYDALADPSEGIFGGRRVTLWDPSIYEGGGFQENFLNSPFAETEFDLEENYTAIGNGPLLDQQSQERRQEVLLLEGGRLRWGTLDRGLPWAVHLMATGRGVTPQSFPLTDENTIRRYHRGMGFGQETANAVVMGVEMGASALVLYQIVYGAPYENVLEIFTGGNIRNLYGISNFSGQQALGVLFALPILKGLMGSYYRGQLSRNPNGSADENLALLARPSTFHNDFWREIFAPPVHKAVQNLTQILLCDGRLKQEKSLKILDTVRDFSQGHTSLAWMSAVTLFYEVANGPAPPNSQALNDLDRRRKALEYLRQALKDSEYDSRVLNSRSKPFKRFYVHHLLWKLGLSTKKQHVVSSLLKTGEVAWKLLLLQGVTKSIVDLMGSYEEASSAAILASGDILGSTLPPTQIPTNGTIVPTVEVTSTPSLVPTSFSLALVNGTAAVSSMPTLSPTLEQTSSLSVSSGAPITSTLPALTSGTPEAFSVPTPSATLGQTSSLSVSSGAPITSTLPALTSGTLAASSVPTPSATLGQTSSLSASSGAPITSTLPALTSGTPAASSMPTPSATLGQTSSLSVSSGAPITSTLSALTSGTPAASSVPASTNIPTLPPTTKGPTSQSTTPFLPAQDLVLQKQCFKAIVGSWNAFPTEDPITRVLPMISQLKSLFSQSMDIVLDGKNLPVVDLVAFFNGLAEAHITVLSASLKGTPVPDNASLQILLAALPSSITALFLDQDIYSPTPNVPAGFNFTALGRFKNMTTLSLSGWRGTINFNILTQTLPNLPNLQNVNMSYTGLGGTPQTSLFLTALFNIPTLRISDLTSNYIGLSPIDTQNLAKILVRTKTSLNELYLDDNLFGYNDANHALALLGSFGNLSSLTCLSFSRNPLGSNPSQGSSYALTLALALQKLTSLEGLNFQGTYFSSSNNNLTSLATAIGNLPNLQEFYGIRPASDAAAFPASFVTALRSAFPHLNKTDLFSLVLVSDVTSYFGGLPPQGTSLDFSQKMGMTLDVLQAVGNGIPSFAKKITSVDLSRNNDLVPPNFGSFQEQFNLILAPIIGELFQVRGFFLAGNQIGSGPQSAWIAAVGNFSQLRILDLSDNSLVNFMEAPIHLGEAFNNTPSLETLLLSQNPYLSSTDTNSETLLDTLGPTFASLKNLTTLDLNRCYIFGIGSGATNLQLLITPSGGSNLTSFFTNLGSARSLKFLNMAYNLFGNKTEAVSLANALRTLTALETLDISYNLFNEGTEGSDAVANATLYLLSNGNLQNFNLAGLNISATNRAAHQAQMTQIANAPVLQTCGQELFNLIANATNTTNTSFGLARRSLEERVLFESHLPYEESFVTSGASRLAPPEPFVFAASLAKGIWNFFQGKSSAAPSRDNPSLFSFGNYSQGTAFPRQERSSKTLFAPRETVPIQEAYIRSLVGQTESAIVSTLFIYNLIQFILNPPLDSEAIRDYYETYTSLDLPVQNEVGAGLKDARPHLWILQNLNSSGLFRDYEDQLVFLENDFPSFFSNSKGVPAGRLKSFQKNLGALQNDLQESSYREYLKLSQSERHTLWMRYSLDSQQGALAVLKEEKKIEEEEFNFQQRRIKSLREGLRLFEKNKGEKVFTLVKKDIEAIAQDLHLNYQVDSPLDLGRSYESKLLKKLKEQEHEEALRTQFLRSMFG